MKMDEFSKSVGLFAAILMPFWNIPLVVRIIRRKTSKDISLLWLFGVWSCIVLMLPASLQSSDSVLRGFGFSNAILFSVVVVVVLIYYREP